MWINLKGGDVAVFGIELKVIDLIIDCNHKNLLFMLKETESKEQSKPQ